MTWTFLLAKLPELLEKTWQQIYLTAAALFIAIVIGIPLGILALHLRKAKQIILATANIFQTIPSLALLGFLLPFLGIGVKPAIITLAIYALLPIVRNTVTGLEGVAPDICEAADGLGFKASQKLWLVEFPLAMPTIIAGIRIATAMSVGIATIAAFVGAGGLGDFIYQGIGLNDNRLILLGAIPAALLALILDFLISRIEVSFTNRKFSQRIPLLSKMIAGCVIILVAISLMFSLRHSFGSSQQENTVVVASKNFTEQYILGYLIADMITAKTSLKVVTKFNLGTTAICQRAMEKGEIDIYPEYTGTAYMTVLHLEHPGNTEQVYQQVKQTYLTRYNIIWLPPFGFNNTNALAVREEFAQQHHLAMISDLIPLAPQLSIAVPADFMLRPDGFIGLQQRYYLHFGVVRQMDPGLMYEALKNKKVDMIMAFSTDGRIPAYHLRLLRDDKHLFPPYYAAPLVRGAVLQAHPEIATALQPLANLLNENTMQQLNYEVDIEKKTPEAVAKNFLISKGLLR